MEEMEIIKWLLIGIVIGGLLATIFWVMWAIDAMDQRK